MKMNKIADNTWQIEKSGNMNVPGVIYASDKLASMLEKDGSLTQVANVATLPGIINASYAMPDIHQGYGFPIGGVAAFDLDEGIISPGGVGFDINCGVRLLATNIKAEDFEAKKDEVLHSIHRSIPTGVGRGNKEKVGDAVLDGILVKGARWAVEHGFGEKEDLEHCEENGEMKNANPKDVSQRAKSRGKPQVGTLGAGNHFIDILKVDEVFNKDTAEKFGVKIGTIVVLIHCGSRGLGHQVASDYIQLMERESDTSSLLDRQLVNAPFKSEIGQKYLSAMNCAVNFAFCNRQMIMHKIREQLKHYFPEAEARLVYDVCHNIAKVEEHSVDGKKKRVCVHRKGATRSFEKQPVLIPGSMGTPSYLMVGTVESEKLSWGSAAHGAGRVMSRTQAINDLNPEEIKADLQNKSITIEINSDKRLKEESPNSYKDIDEVVGVTDNLGLAKKVARLEPIAVIQ